MQVFVCGGMYGDWRKREFKCVCPTGGLPYVRKTEEEAYHLHRLCEHHSHLYQLSEDLKMATLVGRSDWANGLPGPLHADIPAAEQARIRTAISLMS
jgi:hypothetical protein